MRHAPARSRPADALHSLSGHFIDVSEIGATHGRDTGDRAHSTQPQLDPEECGPLGMAARGAESYAPTTTALHGDIADTGPRLPLPDELWLHPSDGLSSLNQRPELLNEARFRLALRTRTDSRPDDESWLNEPFENPPRIVLHPDDDTGSTFEIEACHRFVADQERDLVDRLAPAWHGRAPRADRLERARGAIGRNAAGARSAVRGLALQARAASSALTLMALAGSAMLGVGVLASNPGTERLPAAAGAKHHVAAPASETGGGLADALPLRFAFATELNGRATTADATAFETRFGPVTVTAADDRIRLFIDRRSLSAPISNPIHQASFDLIVPARAAEGILFPLRIEPRERLKSLGAILVSGLPEGTVLSAGTRINRESWGLLPDQIDDLKLWLADAAPEEFTLDVRVFLPSGLTAGHSELRVRRGALYPASGPLPRPAVRDEVASNATAPESGAIERVVATTVEQTTNGDIEIRTGLAIATALVGAQAVIDEPIARGRTEHNGLITASFSSDAGTDGSRSHIRVINREPPAASALGKAFDDGGEMAVDEVIGASRSERAGPQPAGRMERPAKAHVSRAKQSPERARQPRGSSTTAYGQSAKRAPELPERRPTEASTAAGPAPSFALGATPASQAPNDLMKPLPAWARHALKINGG